MIITLNNMRFYAYHGCFEEERVIGTRFSVDLTLEYDATTAARTDDVANAVNYALVYQTVKRVMAVPQHLLETVAQHIVEAVHNEFPAVTRAKVKVCKLNPPLGGQLDYVAVETEL